MGYPKGGETYVPSPSASAYLGYIRTDSGIVVVKVHPYASKSYGEIIAGYGLGQQFIGKDNEEVRHMIFEFLGIDPKPLNRYVQVKP